MLKNYTKVKVDEYGNKVYLNDKGQKNRLDAPAVEWKDGTKFWYINNKRHRNIEPAEEYNEEKYWFFKNKRHRVGEIALQYDNCRWYIHGKEYTKKKYYNIVWEI